MKRILKIEEFAMFLASIFLFSRLSFDWYWFLVLFLTPDISFLGYLINSRTGAFIYNLLHHKGLALLLYGFGFYLSNPALQLTGIIMFGHASFDRIFGYGLKYSDSFNNTHLGIIGKKQ